MPHGHLNVIKFATYLSSTCPSHLSHVTIRLPSSNTNSLRPQIMKIMYNVQCPAEGEQRQSATKTNHSVLYRDIGLVGIVSGIIQRYNKKQLFSFFWVIPRRLNFIRQRFGTHCLFHLHRRVGMQND